MHSVKQRIFFHQIYHPVNSFDEGHLLQFQLLTNIDKVRCLSVHTWSSYWLKVPQLSNQSSILISNITIVLVLLIQLDLLDNWSEGKSVTHCIKQESEDKITPVGAVGREPVYVVSAHTQAKLIALRNGVCEITSHQSSEIHERVVKWRRQCDVVVQVSSII